MASATYVVQTVDKRITSTGGHYLMLKLDDQLVSFFDEKDQQSPVQVGQQVECQIELKGKYKNGHELRIVGPAGSSRTTISSPSPSNLPPTPTQNSAPMPVIKTKIPVDANGRTPLHRLSAAQLDQLYNHICDSAEPAYVGQISNQIRYARLEELLSQLLQTMTKK